MKSTGESTHFHRLLENYRNHLIQAEADWPADVRTALNYLNEHLFETTCTVKKMREDCNLHQRNFSTWFRNYVGMPPVSYLRYHRVEAAKLLLSEEKLAKSFIGEIGFAVGYESPSTFSMLFMKNEKISPGKWRRKNGTERPFAMYAGNGSHGRGG